MRFDQPVDLTSRNYDPSAALTSADRPMFKLRQPPPACTADAISTRERTPVLVMMCDTWVCTVRGEMNSRPPISGLVRPSRTSAAIRFSVSVSPAHPRWPVARPAAGAGPDPELPAAGQRPVPIRQRAHPLEAGHGLVQPIGGTFPFTGHRPGVGQLLRREGRQHDPTGVGEHIDRGAQPVRVGGERTTYQQRNRLGTLRDRHRVQITLHCVGEPPVEREHGHPQYLWGELERPAGEAVARLSP